MKSIFLIFSFLPLVATATDINSINSINTYQELCAKEHDPVKRQNFCHALEQIDHALISEPFRRDIAVA